MPNTRQARVTPLSTGLDGDRLRSLLRGPLVLPHDDAYPVARQLQNVDHDSVRPAAIVFCETPQDVRTCLAYAEAGGLDVHVRSGGHSMGGWSTGPGLVVDVSRINHVSYDGAMVRLGPGTRSVEAIDALAPQNVQLATGTFPTVAAGGFLSGGGLGWQTRMFGVACDRVRSARVVLADGELVRCSATEEPDLFWALRGGGGGNFGVVVDFEMQPIEAPSVVAYETIWRLDDAVEVLAAWQQWCVAGPDELGSSLVVLPPFGPDGVPVVRIWGGFLGPRDQLEASLDDLAERAGVHPISRVVDGPRPFATAMHRLLCGEDTVDECQRTGHSPVARGHRHPLTLQAYRLTSRAVDAEGAAGLLGAWDAAFDQERYLLCIAVGGAANRVDPAATAYAHRDAQFLTGFQIARRAPAPSPADIARMRAWAGRADVAMAGYACGSYINFPSNYGPATPVWGTDHYGENYSRLLEVKRRYDPDDVFHHARSIPIVDDQLGRRGA